jgi:hypothetical protein
MATPKYREYYAGNWLVTSDDAQVKAYIEANIGTVHRFELIKANHKRFKSYLFVVEDLLSSKVKDPDNWPRNILINKYFEGKKPVTPNASSPVETREQVQSLEAISEDDMDVNGVSETSGNDESHVKNNNLNNINIVI